MNKIILFVLIVLIIGIAVYFLLNGGYQSASPSSIPSPSPQSTKNQSEELNKISIENFAFNPPVLNIKVGDAVAWVNRDSSIHTVDSDIFKSGNLNTGESFEFKFNTQGNFDYICGIHPSMKGKIIVE